MDEDDIIKEKQIKIDELSICEIEELIKEYKRKIVDLENKISEKLGLTININHKGKKGGSIKIDYKTLDQLEMITQKLKN